MQNFIDHARGRIDVSKGSQLFCRVAGFLTQFSKSSMFDRFIRNLIQLSGGNLQRDLLDRKTVLLNHGAAVLRIQRQYRNSTWVMQMLPTDLGAIGKLNMIQPELIGFPLINHITVYQLLGQCLTVRRFQPLDSHFIRHSHFDQTTAALVKDVQLIRIQTHIYRLIGTVAADAHFLGQEYGSILLFEMNGRF